MTTPNRARVYWKYACVGFHVGQIHTPIMKWAYLQTNARTASRCCERNRRLRSCGANEAVGVWACSSTRTCRSIGRTQVIARLFRRNEADQLRFRLIHPKWHFGPTSAHFRSKKLQRTCEPIVDLNGPKGAKLAIFGWIWIGLTRKFSGEQASVRQIFNLRADLVVGDLIRCDPVYLAGKCTWMGQIRLSRTDGGKAVIKVLG